MLVDERFRTRRLNIVVTLTFKNYIFKSYSLVALFYFALEVEKYGKCIVGINYV